MALQKSLEETGMEEAISQSKMRQITDRAATGLAEETSRRGCDGPTPKDRSRCVHSARGAEAPGRFGNEGKRSRE